MFKVIHNPSRVGASDDEGPPNCVYCAVRSRMAHRHGCPMTFTGPAREKACEQFRRGESAGRNVRLDQHNTDSSYRLGAKLASHQPDEIDDDY